MNKVLATCMTLIAAAVLTTGCASWNQQDTGTALGAVGGGLLGHAATGGSTAGTIAGAVGGGFIGNRLSQ